MVSWIWTSYAAQCAQRSACWITSLISITTPCLRPRHPTSAIVQSVWAWWASRTRYTKSMRPMAQTTPWRLPIVRWKPSATLRLRPLASWLASAAATLPTTVRCGVAVSSRSTHSTCWSNSVVKSTSRSIRTRRSIGTHWKRRWPQRVCATPTWWPSRPRRRLRISPGSRNPLSPPTKTCTWNRTSRESSRWWTPIWSTTLRVETCGTRWWSMTWNISTAACRPLTAYQRILKRSTQLPSRLSRAGW